MRSVNPVLMQAFLDALEKDAFVPSSQLTRGGMALGAGLTGATIGGLYQGGKKYHEAREQGATRTQALKSGRGGAAVGAGVGGAAGAGLGAAGKLPEGIPLIGGKNPGAAVREFGGQMAHIWTGAGGRHAMRDLGAGSALSLERSVAAEKALRAAQEGKGTDPRMLAGMPLVGRLFKPLQQEELVSRATKELSHAQKAHAAMERAEAAGITSIPGAVKAFVNPKTTREAAGAAYGAAMHGSGPVQKAIVLGLPAATIGMGAIRKPEEGETRLGNIGSAVAGSAAMAMPWMPASIPLSFAPGIPNPMMAAGKVLEHGGRAVGNVASKAVGIKPVQQESQVGQVESPYATGVAP